LRAPAARLGRAARKTARPDDRRGAAFARRRLRFGMSFESPGATALFNVSLVYSSERPARHNFAGPGAADGA
jgi:hypothetical protein